MIVGTPSPEPQRLAWVVEHSDKLAKAISQRVYSVADETRSKQPLGPNPAGWRNLRLGKWAVESQEFVR
jgi:hypothetical protein